MHFKRLRNGDLIAIPNNGMKDPNVIQGYNLASPNLRIKSRRLNRFDETGGPVTTDEIRATLGGLSFYRARPEDPSHHGKQTIKNRYQAVINHLIRESNKMVVERQRRKRESSGRSFANL